MLCKRRHFSFNPFWPTLSKDGLFLFPPTFNLDYSRLVQLINPPQCELIGALLWVRSDEGARGAKRDTRHQTWHLAPNVAIHSLRASPQIRLINSSLVPYISFPWRGLSCVEYQINLFFSRGACLSIFIIFIRLKPPPETPSWITFICLCLVKENVRKVLYLMKNTVNFYCQ